MKRELFRILILILSVIYIFSGCTVQDPETSAYSAPIIGFSQLGAESAWRVANTNSIISACEKADFQVMYENALQKQENQIKSIRSFIAYQVDVIVVAPVVEEGWDTVLQEAKDASIPVILEDRMIKSDLDDLYVSWIGSDFYSEGEKAADFLLEKFANTDDQVNIVELTGTSGSTAALDRHQGFFDTLGSSEQFNLLTSISGDFMISKGREVTAQLLDQYSPEEIDVFYSHNDDMTLGAIEAMESRGIKPGTDIVIITVDAQQKIMDCLKEGKVNCVVECNPDIGGEVIDVIQILLSGEEIPEKIYSEDQVFTEFDDPEAFSDRDY